MENLINEFKKYGITSVEEFNEIQKLTMQALERQVYIITHNMEIAEGIEKGKKEGIKEGIKKGLIKGKFELLLLQLREKYPGIDCKWIEELDESRLIYASKLIMKPISYEEFYDLIMKKPHC